MRGHVIAFQNNDINDVIRCFPMSFEEIPDNMQAIFISVLTENQSIADLIKKSPAFRIDGVNLARWALYLAYIYKDILGHRVNEKVIDQYRSLEQGQMPSWRGRKRGRKRTHLASSSSMERRMKKTTSPHQQARPEPAEDTDPRSNPIDDNSQLVAECFTL
jgi:hypothetical protein